MRKRYLLLILTLIFGLALMAVDRYTQELNQPLSELQNNEADYYGETLLNWHYGDDGKLGQTFRAQRSDHYPRVGITRFSVPMITTRDERGQIWQVTAKEGSLKDDEQIIRFQVHHVITATITRIKAVRFSINCKCDSLQNR